MPLDNFVVPLEVRNWTDRLNNLIIERYGDTDGDEQLVTPDHAALSPNNEYLYINSMAQDNEVGISFSEDMKNAIRKLVKELLEEEGFIVGRIPQDGE